MHRDLPDDLRCDSSIELSGVIKGSGLRAQHKQRFGILALAKVPNAMSACGSSFATTLPATMTAIGRCA